MPALRPTEAFKAAVCYVRSTSTPAVRRVGARFYAPSAYSKLKAFLRKIAERTVAGLLIALDACADIFKPAECVNYFKACGYDTG